MAYKKTRKGPRLCPPRHVGARVVRPSAYRAELIREIVQHVEGLEGKRVTKRDVVVIKQLLGKLAFTLPKCEIVVAGIHTKFGPGL